MTSSPASAQYHSLSLGVHNRHSCAQHFRLLEHLQYSVLSTVTVDVAAAAAVAAALAAAALVAAAAVAGAPAAVTLIVCALCLASPVVWTKHRVC